MERINIDNEPPELKAFMQSLPIDAPIVEGITRRRCPSAAAGAFEVRDMMWKLGWPSACRGA